jgi:hypothetical protein
MKQFIVFKDKLAQIYLYSSFKQVKALSNFTFF